MRNLWLNFCRSRGRFWDRKAASIEWANFSDAWVAGVHPSLWVYNEACDRADMWWRRAGVIR